MLLSQTFTNQLLQGMNEGMIKSWLNAYLPGVFGFFWSVVLAFIAYFVGRKIITVVLNIIEKSMARHDIEKGVRQFTKSVVKVCLYVALLVVILNLFGIETSSVAAGVASMGLTAGLALQGSLSNFAGGVLILVLHPFVVGDYIVEDTHKNEGTVAEITIFYTKLRTVDNKIIVIPNGVLANSSMTNATKSDRRQIDLMVPIGYEDDIRTAKEILEKIAEQEKDRISETEINVFVKELGDSSVNLGLRFWVPTDSYWNIRCTTLEKIKYAFDEAKIDIPYQHVDINVRRDNL